MSQTEEKRYSLAVQLYEYRWNRMGRKGQICRVLARGKMNSCAIEFVDGFRVITSRNAIRKLKASDSHDTKSI